jgi:hypothetical protein
MKNIALVVLAIAFAVSVSACSAVTGAISDATNIANTAIQGGAAVGTAVLGGASNAVNNLSHDTVNTVNTARQALPPYPPPVW